MLHAKMVINYKKKKNDARRRQWFTTSERGGERLELLRTSETD